MAPAVREHPEARTTKGCNFMGTRRILQDALTDEARRAVLREATNRYRNEMMDDEERQLLLVRIKRMRRQLRLV